MKDQPDTGSHGDEPERSATARRLSQTIGLVYRFADDPDVWPSLFEAVEQLGEDADDAVLALLEPHFDAAEEKAGQRERDVAGAVAALDLGKDLSVTAANPAAESLLQAIALEGAGPSEPGRAVHPASDALHEAAEIARRKGAALLVLPIEGGGRMAARLSVVENARGTLRLTALNRASAEDIALSGLESFGLTRAELRLVARVVTGASLAEAAAALGVKEGTVRSQIKSAYAKTGVRSLAALVALVLEATLLARADDAGPPEPEAALNPPPRSHLALADGRTLAWRVYGTADGPPALILTGLFSGSFLRSQIHDAACARGMRLIAPDRPGIGESDRHPGRTTGSVAADCLALLDHLGVRRCTLVVNGMMAAIGMELAARAPERFSRLVLVNPGFAHPDGSVVGPISAPLKRVIGSRTIIRALRNPWIARPFVGVLTIRNNGERRSRQIRRVLGPNPTDLKLMEQPATLAQLRFTFEDARLDRIDGVLDDFAMLRAFKPAPIADEPPVDVWVGGDVAKLTDQNYVRQWAPRAALRIIPGHGKLMFHFVFDEILGRIAP